MLLPDGTGHSSHDLSHILRMVATREPIPTDLLAKIKVPVMIFHGSLDKIVSPYEACEEWQRYVCSCRRRRLRLGH